MAKKNKKKVMKNQPVTRTVKRQPEEQVVYAKVPSGVPIAKPASNIQLTPIVQPVAFVPYSTESQPLLVMDEEYEEYDEY
ncbi:MAG: hypothetical protein ACOCWI_01515 [Bacillota bacterium]